jgi:hypothetical protein
LTQRREAGRNDSTGRYFEFGIFDPLEGSIYCNIEDKSEVTVIDGAKHRCRALPLAPGTDRRALRSTPPIIVCSLRVTTKQW